MRRSLGLWMVGALLSVVGSHGANRHCARGLDINGDGYADIVVGAPDANRVLVFMGSPTGPAPTPSLVLRAPTGGMFGWVVADLHGDGYDNLLVTAPGVGRAYVYRGGPSGLGTVPDTTLVAPAGVRSFGVDAVSLGDTDGDGYAEVAIGSGSDRVFVYRGSPRGLVPTPIAVVRDPHSSELSGAWVTVGDVDGDGQPDLARVDRWQDKPTVTVFRSAGRPGRWVLDTVAGRSPHALAGVGDVNGDGVDDLAVGNSVNGTVSLFFGSVSGLHRAPDVVLTGYCPQGALGWSIAGVTQQRAWLVWP